MKGQVFQRQMHAHGPSNQIIIDIRTKIDASDQLTSFISPCPAPDRVVDARSVMG